MGGIGRARCVKSGGMGGSGRGGAFYDDPQIFRRYGDHRHSGVASPNHVMEEPAFLREVGSVAGLRVLDLGCGDGATGRMLLDAGCRSYLGLDGSGAMADAANAALEGSAGRVERVDMEDFSGTPYSVDLVVSRLALHYVDDVEAVLRACRDALAPGGRVVFTVVHPVLTSYDSGAEGQRTNWVVDNYFVRGPRRRSWMGGTVTWYHRTVEDWLAAVTGAGFSITGVRECAPVPERFEGDAEELARRQRVPLFLLVAGSC